MDLKHFDISAGETGVDVTILDFDNNPTDMKIKVLSMHSKKGREIFLNMLKDGEVGKDRRSELLAKLTVGWKGLTEEGKEVKFSEKEALRIYDKYQIIASQVERFTENAKNFLKK